MAIILIIPLWPPAHRASGPEGKGGVRGILRTDAFL